MIEHTFPFSARGLPTRLSYSDCPLVTEAWHES